MADKFKVDKEVPPQTLEKAKTELRETPEVTEEAIKKLKELLEADKTLHYATRPDILIRYLRPTKYYPESALALMKREADFKDKNSKILKDLTPEMVRQVMTMDNVPVNVLVDRDQDGRRILIQHVGKLWDTKKVNTDQIFQIFYLIHQAALLEPATQINGVVVILDFLGLGLSQVANLTPRFANLLLTFIQKAMPLRLKQVHIVNEPMLFKAVWKLFAPLVEEKLNKRLWFHGSKMENLHKYVDPAYLPTNYGGSLPAINYSAKDWYPILEEATDAIKENNTFGLN